MLLVDIVIHAEDNMDFEKVVSLVGTVTDLRRIASARVIDHNRPYWEPADRESSLKQARWLT